MKNKRSGNSLWGKHTTAADRTRMYAAHPTRFEALLTRLDISPDNGYAILSCAVVKDWVAKHYKHAYVPEWLLTSLGVRTDDDWIDAKETTVSKTGSGFRNIPTGPPR